MTKTRVFHQISSFKIVFYRFGMVYQIGKTTLIALVMAGMAYWIKRIYALSWGTVFFIFLFLFLYVASLYQSASPA